MFWTSDDDDDAHGRQAGQSEVFVEKGELMDAKELLRTCGDTLERRFGSSGDRAFAFFDDDQDGTIS